MRELKTIKSDDEIEVEANSVPDTAPTGRTSRKRKPSLDENAGAAERHTPAADAKVIEPPAATKKQAKKTKMAKQAKQVDEEDEHEVGHHECTPVPEGEAEEEVLEEF